MKTIFVILFANSEYNEFDIYSGITENVTDELIQQSSGYCINVLSKHETDEGIYVGYVNDDEANIADFNAYIAQGDYCTAYLECASSSVFFKKETI